jgi:hypothetical protein
MINDKMNLSLTLFRTLVEIVEIWLCQGLKIRFLEISII